MDALVLTSTADKRLLRGEGVRERAEELFVGRELERHDERGEQVEGVLVGSPRMSIAGGLRDIQNAPSGKYALAWSS